MYLRFVFNCFLFIVTDPICQFTQQELTNSMPSIHISEDFLIAHTGVYILVLNSALDGEMFCLFFFRSNFANTAFVICPQFIRSPNGPLWRMIST